MVEYLTPSAYIEELCIQQFVLDADGSLWFFDTPGPGVELDYDTLKKSCG
jgi:hypothetical protein